MTDNIAIIEAPSATVTRAKEAATSLQAVIRTKPKPVVIRGEQYLEFEDWQLLGQFYGVAVQTGNAESVEINGATGAKASASLYDIHTGIVLGGTGAEAYCMSNEERWNSRPWHQLASMAQTRAGAKALRNRFAWVVVLAGYRATPAEEMESERRPDDKQTADTARTQNLATESQRRKLFATAKQMWGLDGDALNDALKQGLKAKYGIESTKELTKKQASEVIELIEAGESLGAESSPESE